MLKEIVTHYKIKFLANLWVVVLTIFFGANIVHGETLWNNLGPAGFSDGAVDEASIAVHEYECDSTNEQPNPNVVTSEVNTSESLSQSASFNYSGGGTGTDNAKCVEIYVGFRDLDNGAKMSVMKYNPTTEGWDYVGRRGFTPGGTYHTDLAVNSQNVPYVLFGDFSNNQKLTVMKYVSSKNEWQKVGQALLDFGQDTSIKFDNNDVPYVSFVFSSRVFVMKFDGTKWVNIKLDGINNPGESPIETALAIDSNNVPYIAYTNNKNGVTIKKWNEAGQTWDQLGKTLLTESYFVSLKLDSNNVPHVSFLSSYLNSSRAPIPATFVARFDGSKWVYVGKTIDSMNPSALVVGKNSEQFIFYPNNRTSYLGLVQKFDGTAWSNFGKSDFPTGYLSIYDNKAIVVDGAGGLYATFEDESKNGKISVMTTNQNVQSGTFKSWQNVGSVGFTLGVANFISLNIDSQNNKYVAFQDYTNGAKASVMKFDGTSWGYLGTAGFSSGVASQVSSTIDLNDNLYVAYQDGNLSGKATVKKWSGVSWANLGISGFSTGSVSGTNIKVDTAGIPYISYLQGNNTIVKKYNRSTHVWDDLALSSLPQSREVALGIDQNNVPYVALRDVLSGDKLTVMAYNDLLKKWELVGTTAGFSAGTVGNLSLAFSSNNVPEVAFSDGSQAGKVTVMYFDGSSWVNSGNPGFSSGRAGFITMDIDTRDPWNNISYVSFVDYDNAKKISTMKYDPVKGWVKVGSSVGSGLYSSLRLDQNGVPFNAFQDMVNGNKASLMKFE